MQKLYSGKFNPSYGTYINWMIRAGIAKLRAVEKTDGQCIDIIDHWIGKGNLKIFAVLRIKKEDHQKATEANKAPSLKHFKLIHIEIVKRSTGEEVFLSLKELYKKVSPPIAIISDSGSDLVKGIRMLNEDQTYTEKIYHIQDISHKIACILKKHYGKKEWFQDFFYSLGKASKKLYNSKHAHLKAPNQNIKARFMNISKHLKWCISNLERLNKEEFNKEEEKIMKEIYGGLQANEKEIQDIYNLIIIFHEIMKELKINGLNGRSHKKCIEIMANIENQEIKESITEWLQNHYQISQILLCNGWDHSMPISSDPIESFFSKYKRFQNRAPHGDPTRTIALLPLLVGDDTPDEIYNYLTSVSHKEAVNWVEENVPETIHHKKRKSYERRVDKNLPKTSTNVNHPERAYERAKAA